MDAGSRRILGYSMGESMETQMFIDCPNRAKEARDRAVITSTIFHSDHGSRVREYLSSEKYHVYRGSYNLWEVLVTQMITLWQRHHGRLSRGSLCTAQSFNTSEQATTEIFNGIQMAKEREKAEIDR